MFHEEYGAKLMLQHVRHDLLVLDGSPGAGEEIPREAGKAENAGSVSLGWGVRVFRV